MLQIKRLNKVEALINRWQTILQIEDWDIKTEKISIFQVSDDFCSIGHQFVGVSQDRINKLATIHHTRILVEEDIIHELLHVRHPNWSEEEVVSHTNLLMRKKEKEMKFYNVKLKKPVEVEDKVVEVIL